MRLPSGRRVDIARYGCAIVLVDVIDPECGTRCRLDVHRAPQTRPSRLRHLFPAGGNGILPTVASPPGRLTPTREDGNNIELVTVQAWSKLLSLLRSLSRIHVFTFNDYIMTGMTWACSPKALPCVSMKVRSHRGACVLRISLIYVDWYVLYPFPARLCHHTATSAHRQTRRRPTEVPDYHRRCTELAGGKARRMCGRRAIVRM
ncbi:uncharacterized protein C8Q71DRAFT_247392 [Rhodofomes roseus]|uniref:Uncharacterized protein n=1 Tax=Rhodofomes roseus TaxID=34475 RepID=A0ABQ8K6Z7_9APHY|nr:uncharacterized protein C8Q71DRAFT_247392 [Rhodofomes roseus]KAH9833008.1 hypothetical protein C8Q71DRAFT_247392 [Rhodofomes roseus]